MNDMKFSNELGKRENTRLNAKLKPGEGFCPACGRTIKKTVELCAHCNTYSKARINPIHHQRNAPGYTSKQSGKGKR